jgi:L-malate glycosyltransferase
VRRPDRRAIDVNVLFVHFGDEWIAGSEVALLELLRNLPDQGVRPTLWCNATAMQEAARAVGVPTHRDDFAFYFDYASPPFSPRGYLGLVGRARRMISRCAADLVHCNGGAPAQWMRPACWLTGAPMLVNLHSPYLRRSRYVLGLRLADQIVAVSAGIAQPLLAEGMPADRVSVVYNGFDEEALMQGDASTLRAHLQIPAGAVVGAIAGSLIHRKGHDILFKAMRMQAGSSRALHLLVIGDGPARDPLKALADGLPIHFLGYRKDLGAVLRDATDVLIAPSRQEGFGRVIIEAAFAGVPAIGARVDGIPEAIEDGVTGLLVAPESPDELAAAIGRLAEDAPLRAHLGAAAQARARRQFTIGACAAEIRAQYEKVVQRRKPASAAGPVLDQLRLQTGRRSARLNRWT